MSAPLSGKVALITGASKGIGAQTALHLASLGAKVAINFSSDPKPAEEVVAALNKMTEGIAIKGDAGSVAGVDSIVKAVVDKFGKIDILVLNAGVMHMHNLEGTTEEAFDLHYNVNVKGPYFMAQKAVPHMPKGSSIIFISTSVNHTNNVMPGYLLYCSTKGAIEQMVRVLTKDLGAKGIHVNCIAPGPINTELFTKGKSDEMIAGIAKTSPFGRIGEPEEVANAIGLLVRGEAGWISGQVLKVNGGMV